MKSRANRPSVRGLPCRGAGAPKNATAWYELEFEEMADTLSSDMPDFLLRSDFQLGLPEELTRNLLERRRQLSKVAKLRRAEILLNSEMPRISYDETDALGKTIRSYWKMYRI